MAKVCIRLKINCWKVLGVAAVFFLSWTAHAGTFDIRAIKTLIASHKIQTIAALLPLLPAEMRGNYVLMFQSESLQQASVFAPRVLLFSDDGKLVVTFNGGPNQYGFETLETMSFEDQGKKDRFIFEEIVFPGDLVARSRYLAEQNAFDELKQLARDHENPNRQGPNPQVCRGCHKQDPRPNWNQGLFWPGAYGRIDDAFWNQRMTVKDPVTGENTSALDHDEFESIKALKEIFAHHPRYRYIRLSFHGADSYQVLQTFNLKFTMLVGALNAQRIARILSQSKGYSRFRRKLMQELMDCPTANTQPPQHLVNLQKILEPWHISIWDLSTHFHPGEGNLLSARRLGPVIPKALSERDPSVKDMLSLCTEEGR